MSVSYLFSLWLTSTCYKYIYLLYAVAHFPSAVLCSCWFLFLIFSVYNLKCIWTLLYFCRCCSSRLRYCQHYFLHCCVSFPYLILICFTWGSIGNNFHAFTLPFLESTRGIHRLANWRWVLLANWRWPESLPYQTPECTNQWTTKPTNSCISTLSKIYLEKLQVQSNSTDIIIIYLM